MFLIVTGRIVHHRQAATTRKTVGAQLASIIITFLGQYHPGNNSRIVRKIFRVEARTTMQASEYQKPSR